MKSCPNLLWYLIPFLTLSLFFSPSVYAAAPDGLGPWADFVVTSSQANTKGGTPVSVVNPARSDPTSALGVAENDTVDGHFFSLGFGGSITLGFDNGISSGVFIVEATNPGYPDEKAKVELSEDGSTWVNAGTVTQDGSVTKPESLGCTKYVRITDISNPADFSDATADGYDVDGVRAEGEPCTLPTPTPTITPTPTGICGCGVGDVDQKNNTNVSVGALIITNTGGNKTNKNNGNVNVTTGNASSSADVNIGGSTNKLTSGGNCCCPGGNTNITISNNGAGSTNSVTVKKNSGKSPGKKK